MMPAMVVEHGINILTTFYLYQPSNVQENIHNFIRLWCNQSGDG
jgi:hypothetical protein